LIVATGVGDLARTDVAFVALADRLATRGRIGALQAQGLAVHVWGLYDEDAMMRAILDGADSLIVSDPLAARRVVERYAAASAAERLLLRLALAFDLRGPVPPDTLV
ncbi:MAG: hypothetical protein ACOCYE_12180, partial [Pseudomonadota bacterium]